jgi:ubiquinone/menaquinone biosynthesis C-methylase UbiE/ribulose-5-phosphate 4-epimerase/fuculose-1-phosphate aldolase
MPKIKPPLKVLITGGGCVAPIDPVRFLGNSSKGTTAAQIVEAFLTKGCEVTYIHAQNATQPWELKIPHGTPLEKAKTLALQNLEKRARYEKKLKTIPIRGVQDYLKTCLEAAPSHDIGIFAMAVSDYEVVNTSGEKIPSGRKDLTLHLVPTPKVISKVKEANPHLWTIGFKLLDDSASPEALFTAAYKGIVENKADLYVANLADKTFHPTKTYIVNMEGNIQPVERQQLADQLCKRTLTRFSKTFFSTTLQKTKVRKPKKFSDLEAACEKLALFLPYLDGRDAKYGFLAHRTPNGTLITGRGSNKNTDSVCLITHLDGKTVYAKGETKPSLNGALAHQIFKKNPKVQWIIHSHIDLPKLPSTKKETRPGTLEDLISISGLETKNAFSQPHHGVFFLLGENPEEEIKQILEANNCFQKQPHLYEKCYQRFLKSRTLEDWVTTNFPTKAQILDLAGGTGHLCAQLEESGYKHLTLADKSLPMLRTARQRLKTTKTLRYDMASGKTLPRKYDVIVIRQAINYVEENAIITKLLPAVFKSLKPKGWLAFTSFSPTQDPPSYREHSTNTEKTFEWNQVKNKVLTHAQLTIDYESGKVIHDLNTFYTHGVFWLKAFLRAGWKTHVRVLPTGNGSGILVLAQKI